jgi:hypothetical protein
VEGSSDADHRVLCGEHRELDGKSSPDRKLSTIAALGATMDLHHGLLRHGIASNPVAMTGADPNLLPDLKSRR